VRPCINDHIDSALCWRCSDQVGWWAEARQKAGIELYERRELDGHAPLSALEADRPGPGVDEFLHRVQARQQDPSYVVSAQHSGRRPSARNHGAPTGSPEAAGVLQDIQEWEARVDDFWSEHPDLTRAQARETLRRREAKHG